LPATSSTAAIGCLRFLICDQPRCHRFARHEPVDEPRLPRMLP
jgi:hypothetical protein